MIFNWAKGLALICGMAVFTVFSASAGTLNLITNGTFETGNLSGWTTTSAPYGNITGGCGDPFATQSTAMGCISSFAPAFGTYAAYASATFPSNNTGGYDFALMQNVVVPITSTATVLSWENEYSATGSGSAVGGVLGIEIFAGTTYINSDFVLNIPSPANHTYTLPWTAETWNLTSILQPYEGQTLLLKLITDTFSNSQSSASQLSAAFDNVALNVTTPDTAVPEPSTWLSAAMLTLLLGGGMIRRRV